MLYFNKTTQILLILFLLVTHAHAKPVAIDQVVASVDGVPILESELNKEKDSVAQMLKFEKKESEMDQPIAFKKRVLQQMIEDQLLDREIARLGLEATDAQVEQVIANIMKENNISSKDDFKRMIRAEGLSFEEFENNYRKRVSRNNFIRQNIQPKINITEDDIQKLVEQTNSDKKNAKKFFEFAMLFVPQSSMNKDEFLTLVSKVQKGEPFETFVSKYSQGPQKDKGGYMGKVNEEDLNEKIKDALVSMKNNEISNAIEMKNGWATVKKIDEGLQTITLSEEEKGKITDELFNQRVVQALNQTLTRLEQKALIEKFL